MTKPVPTDVKPLLTQKAPVYSPDELVVIGADVSAKALSARYDNNPTALDVIAGLADEERAKAPIPAEFILTLSDGVFDPIVVVDLGPDRDGASVLVVANGGFRVRGLRKLNAKRRGEGHTPFNVIAVVRKVATRAEAIALRAATGTGRIAVTPIQRARMLSDLVNECHVPLGQAARYLGCGEQTARDLLALLTLEPEAQAAVSAGDIPTRAAKRLAEQPPEEQRKRGRRIAETGAKGTAAEKMATAPDPRLVPPAPPLMRRRDEIEFLYERLEGEPEHAGVRAVLGWTLGYSSLPGDVAAMAAAYRAERWRILASDERTALDRLLLAKGGPEATAKVLGISILALSRCMRGVKIRAELAARVASVLAREAPAEAPPGAAPVDMSKLHDTRSRSLTPVELAALAAFIDAHGGAGPAAKALDVSREMVLKAKDGGRMRHASVQQILDGLARSGAPHAAPSNDASEPRVSDPTVGTLAAA